MDVDVDDDGEEIESRVVRLRPWTPHRDHDHEATEKARRECRKESFFAPTTGKKSIPRKKEL